MKNKLMLMLMGINFIAIGCQVVLENDLDTWVAVTDLEANHPTQLVKRKVKIEANKNPDVHADLRVMIGPRHNLNKASYRIKQIACSQTHIIPIKASDIARGMLDPRIFTIEKENILTPKGV